MKATKRILTLLMSLILIISSVSVIGMVVSAETISSGTCGDNLTWILDDEGTLTISGTGAMTDYDNGTAPWYSLKNSIKNIYIENGITSIGNCAFYELSCLENFTIHNSVRSIGKYAFYECNNLKRCNYTGTVKEWCGISFLTEKSNPCYYGDLYINDSILAEIKASDLIGVTSIGDYAFYNNDCLTYALIPGNVVSIGKYAFYSCDNLSNVVMSEGLKNIGECSFTNCYSLFDCILPDGVISIGSYAFYEYHMAGITIPASVQEIGGSAVSGDTVIRCYSESAAYDYAVNNDRSFVLIDDESTWYEEGLYGSNASWKINKLTGNLYVECDGNLEGKEGTDYSLPWENYCDYITSIIIDEGCTGIGSYLFGILDNVRTIELPSTLKHIGYFAFSPQKGSPVIIPAGVEYIGSNAFGNFNYGGYLDSITVMNRDCIISDSAFYYCNTIKGFIGSTAETYAKNNGFKFVSIDAEHTHEYDNDCDAICNTCNYEREITHSVSEWTTVTPATCVQKEIQQGTCSECGKTVTRELETGDHSFNAKTVVAPTCTTMGYTIYECTYCGMLYTADITSPVDHTDADGDGKCDICGSDIPAKTCEHKFVLTYTDATCTEKGSVTMTCSECGYSTSTEIAAKGHNYVDFVTAPTCTTEGYTLHHCATCGEEYTDTKVSATGHSIRMQKITPTCTENGCDLYICSTCGYNYFANEVAATGHTASLAVKENVVLSTMTAAGHYDNVVYCSVCDAEISRETVTTPATNPTAGAVLNAAGGSVDYRTKVTLKATASGVPTGYYVAIYDGNTQVARGDNGSVSYSIGEMKSGKTYTVKIVDANGNVQKDASGNALQKEVNISVNSSFIKKLVAFFKGLFGSLPSKTIGA